MTGEVTHLAGSGERTARDGPALQASFTLPNGIAATADGERLYVSNIISKKSPPGPTREPSGLRVRLVVLPSLTDRLTDASHGGEKLDLDALAEEYYRLRKDPVPTRNGCRPSHPSKSRLNQEQQYRVVVEGRDAGHQEREILQLLQGVSLVC